MVNLSHILIALGVLAMLVVSWLPIRLIIDSPKLTLGQKCYWLVVVIGFPILGSLAWLTLGRRAID